MDSLPIRLFSMSERLDPVALAIAVNWEAFFLPKKAVAGFSIPEIPQPPPWQNPDR